MEKEEIMERAIELGLKAMDYGNTPFGAVIAKDGEIISEAMNKITSEHDPTAHAELLAISRATKKLGRADLSDCELYASGEPCTMCLSAIYFSGIKTVYVAYSKEEAAKYDIGSMYVRKQLQLPDQQRDIQYTFLQPENVKHPYKEWKKRTDN